MAGCKIRYDYLPDDGLSPIEGKYIIGLTGNIGSGKTTVARMFEKAGMEVIDADRCARELQQPGQEGYRRMMEAFGPDYFQEDGQLDRKRFGALVFADDEQRKRLNAALLPLIVQRMYALAKGAKGRFVVLDAPLLLETGMDAICNAVYLVAAEEETRIQRVMQREGIDYARAYQMAEKQIPQGKKIPLADVVIENNAGMEELEKIVAQRIAALKKEWN